MMKMPLLRYGLLLLMLPMLTACSLGEATVRVGVLVLIPALLVIAVMWLLNRRGGEEKWEEDHYPDADQDDEHEDHHLM
jgi:hypothetical protein